MHLVSLKLQNNLKIIEFARKSAIFANFTSELPKKKNVIWSSEKLPKSRGRKKFGGFERKIVHAQVLECWCPRVVRVLLPRLHWHKSVNLLPICA